MPPSHQTLRLSAGRHSSPSDGVCVMELASMLAGEPFTDHPRAVAPTLASALRGYNDGLDDARRQTLKRYAAVAVGTPSDRRSERERRRLVQAWLAESSVRGLRSRLSRLLESADPYTVVRRAGKRVATQDDEALHARVVALLDALAAAGRERDATPEVLSAPSADPCSHPCGDAADQETLTA